jgi:peptidoglycan/LPS O-acetylase OafA/YrhL
MIDWYLRLTNAVAFNSSFGRMTAFMLVSMVVAAAISYYVVERPALRLKDRDLQSWLRRRGTVHSDR